MAIEEKFQGMSQKIEVDGKNKNSGVAYHPTPEFIDTLWFVSSGNHRRFLRGLRRRASLGLAVP